MKEWAIGIPRAPFHEIPYCSWSGGARRGQREIVSSKVRG